MMRNLLLDEGDLVQVESMSLPIATFSKFEPQTEEFLDITNPKAVLENALRNFACLTADDVIAINYNDQTYELRVLEVKPGTAVSIIECDMNVEFAAPPGYEEPRVAKAVEPMEEEDDVPLETMDFFSFKGTGNRLDGKKKNLTLTSEELQSKLVRQKGIPDYDYQPLTIKFFRKTCKMQANEKEESCDFQTFQGEGSSLRKPK